MTATKCTCRFCQKLYDPNKSRADYTGYCSQKCMKDMAYSHGWRKGQDEYATLKPRGLIGNVPAATLPIDRRTER